MNQRNGRDSDSILGQLNFPLLLQLIQKISFRHTFIDPHIRVISEPGRYFVSSAYTLATGRYLLCQIKRPIPNPIPQQYPFPFTLFVLFKLFGAFGPVFSFVIV